VVHLNGRWRIVEMDVWDQEAIGLVAPGFIEFGDDGTGEFGFIAVRGWMDCRPGERGGGGSVEFSWPGDDEGDEVSGRGWAELADDGSLQGHLYFHVFTKARGRDAVFWQSPRTRKQARPNVRTPTARAAGLADLEIVVDSHEQYPYRFASQQATVVKRALPCGDYGLVGGGRLIASVERKSLADLVASLTGGKLRYALAELAALPRAAIVIEDRYSAIFKLDRLRPAMVADGLAELQVRWPNCARPVPARWPAIPGPRHGHPGRRGIPSVTENVG
jgi:hypothetical protein